MLPGCCSREWSRLTCRQPVSSSSRNLVRFCFDAFYHSINILIIIRRVCVCLDHRKAREAGDECHGQEYAYSQGLEEEANQGQGQGQEQETGVRAAVSGQHHSRCPCSGGREPAQL